MELYAELRRLGTSVLQGHLRRFLLHANISVSTVGSAVPLVHR